MQEFEYENLARDFGRNLTGEIAPLEPPFFDELIDAHQRPKSARRDRTLAFGVSAEGGVVAVALYEIGKVALQAVWKAAEPVLRGLADDAAKQFRESFGKKLRLWIESRLSSPPPFALKPNALNALLDAAKRISVEQGLDEAQSIRIVQTLTRSFGQQ